MLSIEALNSAMPLTEVVDTVDLKIVPIGGTPLERLVQATRSDDNFVTINGTNVMPSLSDIEYIANAKDPILGGSPHDKAFDDVVDFAVKAVQEHMTFARNVVRPAVQGLVEAVATQIEMMTPNSLLGMEVITYNPPAPLQNSALDNMVRQFEDTSFDVPRLGMACPDLTVAEIIELMKTGSSSLDRDVETWLATLGESCIIKVYEGVFQQKQNGMNDRRVVTFRDYTEDKECGADNALMIFLLARRLMDDPLPGTEMNTRAYSNLMAEFRNQAGARVCRALNELEKIGKTKTLVKAIVDGKTTVYGFVYDAWIKAGGSNEILFGNTMTTPYLATVDNINAKSEELKSKWARHSASIKTIESNRRFLRVKEALVYNFERQLREAGGEFIEEATIGNRDVVAKRFRELVNDVTSDEVKDLHGLVLKLVCRARFARTDAERILAGIESVQRENPTISVREAAAVSVIDYISYWVASQMKVERAI